MVIRTTRDHTIPADTRFLNLLVLLIVGIGTLLHVYTPVALAQSSPVQSAPSAATPMKLNTTGRALVMPVPLRDGTATLGELVARIDPEDRIWVRKAKLLRLLGKHVKPDVIAAIRALPDQNGRIDIASLGKSGAELQFDHSEVALKLVSRADLKAAKKIDLGGFRQTVASAAAPEPAAISGYLNVTAGAEHLWAGQNTKERSSLHVELQSAIRLGGVVIQNKGSYDGAVDSERCPRGAVCTYKHQNGLKRQTSRIVYDRPEMAIRLQAGDTATRTAGFQR